MAGAAIAINDAAAADTILSVKQRVFAWNRTLFVRRQRLVYTAGPSGMDALADDETLGGAGVAQDGSAKLDVLLADLSEAEAEALGRQVWLCLGRMEEPSSFIILHCLSHLDHEKLYFVLQQSPIGCFFCLWRWNLCVTCHHCQVHLFSPIQ